MKWVLVYYKMDSHVISNILQYCIDKNGSYVVCKEWHMLINNMKVSFLDLSSYEWSAIYKAMPLQIMPISWMSVIIMREKISKDFFLRLIEKLKNQKDFRLVSFVKKHKPEFLRFL